VFYHANHNWIICTVSPDQEREDHTYTVSPVHYLTWPVKRGYTCTVSPVHCLTWPVKTGSHIHCLTCTLSHLASKERIHIHCLTCTLSHLASKGRITCTVSPGQEREKTEAHLLRQVELYGPTTSRWTLQVTASWHSICRCHHSRYDQQRSPSPAYKNPAIDIFQKSTF